jgi:hypothetical protein
MPDYQSIKKYYESINEELKLIKDRVRYLVKHFGEDGRYKEAILKNVLRRHLPSHFLIGTGFIVKSLGDYENHASTKQIDLIIYDSSKPVLFSEGDFVILTPDCVSGIISVKTNIENQNLMNEIKSMNEIGEFIYEGLSDFQMGAKLFNGIFSYEGYTQINTRTIQDKIEGGFTDVKIDHSILKDEYKNFMVNHITLNEKYFIKSWPHKGTFEIDIYELENLSFSYFISHILHTVSRNDNLYRQEIRFPVDKRIHKLLEFYIDLNTIKRETIV